MGHAGVEDLTAPILLAANKDEGLRDEVFVQVMKQLTENDSSKSSTHGFELLQKLVKDAPLPSAELCEYLRGFLEKAGKPVEKDAAAEEEAADAPMMKRKSTVHEFERRQKNRTATLVNFVQKVQPQMADECLEILQDRLAAK